MGATYAEFKRKFVKLEPVEVRIGGLDEPILIHQFTVNDIKKLDEGLGEDVELQLRKKVLRFLNGLDADVSEEACAELGDYFAGWQVREIFTKAIKLNGFGPEALREAEKN